jgi:hypothetical protein
LENRTVSSRRPSFNPARYFDNGLTRGPQQIEFPQRQRDLNRAFDRRYAANMPLKHRYARILRRITRVSLIAVLLLAIYVSQFFAMFWLAGDGMLPPQPFNFMRNTIFYPMEWLAFTPLPMSPYVRATAEWCRTRGNGRDISWSEWYAHCEGVRIGKPTPYPR